MTEENCPFCDPDPACLFYRGENVFGIWDAYPVSEGHALLVTTRHVASWFDATREEHMEIASALTIAREAILAKHHPDGFNIGVNIGETAGQTVPHLHVHLIPRYSQDVQDPRGGVRHVIPSRANYLKPESSSVDNTADRVADAGPETLQNPALDESRLPARHRRRRSAPPVPPQPPRSRPASRPPRLLHSRKQRRRARVSPARATRSQRARPHPRRRLPRHHRPQRSPTPTRSAARHRRHPGRPRLRVPRQELPPQGLYLSRRFPKLWQRRRLRRKLEPQPLGTHQRRRVELPHRPRRQRLGTKRRIQNRRQGVRAPVHASPNNPADT